MRIEPPGLSVRPALSNFALDPMVGVRARLLFDGCFESTGFPSSLGRANTIDVKGLSSTGEDVACDWGSSGAEVV